MDQFHPLDSRCDVSFKLMVCSGHHVSLRLLSLHLCNECPSLPKKEKEQCEGPVKLDFDQFLEDAYSVQGHFESDDDLDFEDPHYNMVSLRCRPHARFFLGCVDFVYKAPRTHSESPPHALLHT